MKKERYLVPAYGPDVEALKIALQALEILGSKFKSDVAIVVPTLNNAINTVLNQVIPENQLKSLIKGASLILGENKIPLSLVSQKTLNKSRASVLLGVFASENMIKKIESCAYCKAIIILPWAGDTDVKKWKEKWSPTILNLNEKT